MEDNLDLAKKYRNRLLLIDSDQMLKNLQDELEKWKIASYATIEEHFKETKEKIENYFNERKSLFSELQEKIETLEKNIQPEIQSNEEDIQSIKLTIRTIEDQLNEIERTSVKLQMKPLKLDENSFSLSQQFQVENLSKVLGSFPYSQESSSALAGNDQFILFHQYPYISFIDENLKIVQQKFWRNGWIRDICWSNVLHSFIVVTSNRVYLVDEKLDIKTVSLTENESWFSCLSSENTFFISTCQWGSKIYQYDLSSSSSSFELKKKWEPPLTCENDEGINDIKSNNGKIALTIKKKSDDQKRVELKSMETFETIWKIQLAPTNDIRLFTCSPISFNDWLVVDGATSMIYHITNDGKFGKQFRCNSVPYRIHLFRNEKLVLSSEDDLSFHPIE